MLLLLVESGRDMRTQSPHRVTMLWSPQLKNNAAGLWHRYNSPRLCMICILTVCKTLSPPRELEIWRSMQNLYSPPFSSKCATAQTGVSIDFEPSPQSNKGEHRVNESGPNMVSKQGNRKATSLKYHTKRTFFFFVRNPDVIFLLWKMSKTISKVRIPDQKKKLCVCATLKVSSVLGHDAWHSFFSSKWVG